VILPNIFDFVVTSRDYVTRRPSNAVARLWNGVWIEPEKESIFKRECDENRKCGFGGFRRRVPQL
jgi:hypothetical protein